MTTGSGTADTGTADTGTADTGTASFASRAGRGLRWSLLGTIANKIGSFAMGLVLARLLAPSDFGTYAIALAATQFVMHINDVGLIAATVQWRGKLEEMAATAATLAVLFSVAVYAIFWFAAPWFAGLAGSPDATPVVRLLTAIILIDGLTAVRAASLIRNFQQDKLTRANLIGLVVNAAVAISLAAAGAGAYSFAVGQVACWLVTGVFVFIFAKVPLQVGLDRAIAAKLMRFGIPLAASLGVEAVLVNADYVIVGRVMGIVALGYYLLAFNVSSWAQGIIGTAIRYVSVPVFSRLSEGKEGALSAGVLRTFPLLITALVPIAVLLAVLASPLVSVLYGERWLPAVSALSFLMVLTVVRVVTSFALDILTGAGATRSTLWVNLGWGAALVPTLWVGTHLGGIRGTAIGHAVVGVLVALPLFALAVHRAGVRLAPIAPLLVRPMLAGVLAGGVALLVARLTGPYPFVRLFVAGSAGLLIYVATAVPLEQLRQWASVIRPRRAHAVN